MADRLAPDGQSSWPWGSARLRQSFPFDPLKACRPAPARTQVLLRRFGRVLKHPEESHPGKLAMPATDRRLKSAERPCASANFMNRGGTDAVGFRWVSLGHRLS